MNKEKFIELIDTYQKYDKYLLDYSDIINFEHPLFAPFYKIFDLYLRIFFNNEQVDTIYWWLYEYPKGNKKWDEIDLSTTEKLWDFLQE